MNNSNNILNKIKLAAVATSLLCLVSLSACQIDLSQTNGSETAISEEVIDEMVDITEGAAEIADNVAEITEDIADAVEIIEEEIIPPVSDEEMVAFDPENPFSYCKQPVCHYDKETGLINYTIEFKSIPRSDNPYIYLFEAATYEDDNSFDCKPYIASAFKDHSVTFSFPYTDHYLFSRFVPVIAYEKTFYPLSLGQYMTNPEEIAKNTTPYPVVDSKKGILLDPMTVNKDELKDLNVKRVVYNLPLSFIMGETDNELFPTIDYEYMGHTYKFNGFQLSGFDTLFKYLSKNNYHITAIILNDWTTDFPEVIHPLSRKKTSQSMYYAFNTEEEAGVRAIEAAALFLSQRYSGGEYGLIHDWVIANEINQQKVWNYMATDDIDLYTESFEKSFRTFYNAIKANYANANVYYSIDQDWNCNGGANYRYFNGRSILEKFNEFAKLRGDYDWALSIHPYPSPLTKTRFWNGRRDKSENARVVTPMNLTVVTDFMQKADMLDTKGNVRQIGITELGFSSKAGEKAQAAAFAYCYRIIEDNKYINSFLMNRQTDSYLSLQSGLALGIYNPDYSAKYIKDVFAEIDSDKGDDYIPEMLETIGASSLEEALEWAR